MSTEGEFYIPADAILRELGRMQVLHSHLDHMLRLVIKRMLGISLDDPGYWNETRGMAAALRERARKLIAERYSDDEDASGILRHVLGDAEEVTVLRNRALHSVWMKTPDGEPLLHDQDKTLEMHRAFQLPTVEDLVSVSDRIERIKRGLDDLTRKLL